VVEENTSTRRGALRSTATLVTSGTILATAGCLDGGFGPSLDGEIVVEGPMVSVSASTDLSATDTGYELAITVSNNSERTADTDAEVIWEVSNDENAVVTQTETKTVDPGGETTLVVTAEDPNDSVTAYSATVLAVPA